MKKIKYADVGDNYDTKDPIKILAQVSASTTSENLTKQGFQEISETRGESAYVWKQGNIYMAMVMEQLGTKNLVADDVVKITGKTHYDVIGHDTIATIINDLCSVGAQPLVVSAYWSIESNAWLADKERMTNLILGWKNGCDLAGASWGGGETPTLKGIMKKNTAAFGGSAVGIITSKKRLVLEKNLMVGDRIIFLKSNGINANGLSLARAIAKKLPKGYATKLASGELYGDAILKKTNIYAKLIQDLLNNNIDIHYISNITGHGLRKIMRSNKKHSYVIEKIFPPQELFLFMQQHAGLTDHEMYEEFNMGQDYAIFIPEQDVAKALMIIRKNKFHGLNAGRVEKGKRQVIIEPMSIVFHSEALDLR